MLCHSSLWNIGKPASRESQPRRRDELVRKIWSRGVMEWLSGLLGCLGSLLWLFFVTRALGDIVWCRSQLPVRKTKAE